MKLVILFVWWSSIQLMLMGIANAVVSTFITKIKGSSVCDWRRLSDLYWPCCALPVQPEFYPHQGYPRLFNVGVYYQELLSTYLNDANPYYALTLSPWPNKQLDCISQLYGRFYLMRKDGNWALQGQFGPLWMRRTTDDTEKYRYYQNLPGFWYDGPSTVKYFRFFLPDSADSNPTADLWFQYPGEREKTSFQAGVSVASICINGFHPNILPEPWPEHCYPAETPISEGWMDNFNIKSHPFALGGNITKADLLKEYLILEYDWNIWDVALLYNQASVQGPDADRPLVKVVLFDSNPGNHNDWNEEDQRKNVRVKAVLAAFQVKPTWNSTTNKPQSYFSFKLSDGGWHEGQLTQFLYDYPFWDYQGHYDSDFYSAWNTNTGLSIALTVCSPISFLGITDREAGCRDYMIKTVKIRERDPMVNPWGG